MEKDTDAVEMIEEEISEQPAADFPWVMFSIDGVVYGVFSTHVLSIEILRDTTPLVDSPYYTRGITNFRGEMISLVDLRALFGLSQHEMTEDFREMMVVLEVDGIVKGFLVDEIIAVEYVERILEMEGLAEKTQYVRCLGKREKDNSTIQIIDEAKIIQL